MYNSSTAENTFVTCIFYKSCRKFLECDQNRLPIKTGRASHPPQQQENRAQPPEQTITTNAKTRNLKFTCDWRSRKSAACETVRRKRFIQFLNKFIINTPYHGSSDVPCGKRNRPFSSCFLLARTRTHSCTAST